MAGGYSLFQSFSFDQTGRSAASGWADFPDGHALDGILSIGYHTDFKKYGTITIEKTAFTRFGH